MLKAFFICSLTIITATPCFSQVKRFHGQVYDSENHQPLDSVYFFHKKTKIIAFSSKEGNFTFNGFPGDSIIVSRRGFLRDTVIFRNEEYKNIGLIKGSIVLEEVAIKAKRNSPLEDYRLNRMLYKDIYLKGDKKNMVNVTPVGVAVSINKVFSALSKEGKDARRMQRKIDTEYRLDEVDSRFNKQLVSKITHLEGKDLSDFISEYRPDFGWINSASDYEIIVYIKEKLPHFLKNRAKLEY
ncbi:hypothetical protein ACSBL2_15675 [Pedobacter sp. AW31-3R]|uniref:hypothetical protein n=1 Tax=Pedobacter sp. AW31-3R TaxID=3445781 RepID=UPI003FA149E2